MTLDDFVKDDDASLPRHDFPDALEIGSMRLPLEYQFQPGADDDGVTLTVPLEGLGQLSADRLEWLVPGLLPEKISALIRTLPKTVRRSLVPAAETVEKVLSGLASVDGPLLPTVAAKLSEVAGERISADAFRLEKLPAHLRFNVRVIDEHRQIQASGRNLDEIRRAIGPQQPPELGTMDHQQWHRDRVTCWDFPGLSREVRVVRGGIEVAMFPSVIDVGDSVQLRLSDSPENARYLNLAGIRRLYALAHQNLLRRQVRWLPRWDETCVLATPVMAKDKFQEQVQDLIADRAFLADGQLPTDQREFAARSDDAGQRIAVATQEVAAVLPKIFESLHRAYLALEQLGASRWREARDDIRSQLTELTDGPFLTSTPWTWLTQFPRYLGAIEYRIGKLTSGGQARDLQSANEVARFWQRYAQWRDAGASPLSLSPNLELYRWMIEEFRVSLFAQPLGTTIKVSPQRLETAWTIAQQGRG
jgi:ATP-dependent helicase HrpA